MISIAQAAVSAGEHAQSSGGLPQFDASTFSSQIFWTVVSFAVLLYLLKNYVIPPINDILDARGKEIAEDLEKAKKAREDSESTLAKYRQELAAARQEASRILDQARAESNRLTEAAKIDLEQDLAKRKSAALEEIEQAKRTAMNEIKSSAVEVAMEAAEKLIGKSVTKTDANKMVEQAIADLEKDQMRAFH
ncbi:MAG: F0F1 ATP synthase subunit B [Magnetococcales bacterium]|nr:F0F1 ATP synthase subunit B [Magnetococcales bacterium]